MFKTHFVTITDMGVGDTQISICHVLNSLPSLFIRQQTIYNLFLLSATILPALRNEQVQLFYVI
jgi:hypothetical protein